MTSRQDDTFRRLHNYPLWKRGKQVTEVHAKCRNMYLNEKSYKLFEAKRGFL